MVKKLICMIEISDIRGTFRDCYKIDCISYGMNCAMKFKIDTCIISVIQFNNLCQNLVVMAITIRLLSFYE